MDKNYCSPKNSDNLITCFSNESLLKIANKYNKNNPKIKIEIPDELNKENRTKLWNSIKENIEAPCKDDHCLLYNSLIKDINDKEIMERTFKPETPKTWIDNKNTWLSTIDIMKVMKQYQDKYKDFKFIGPTPIDFEKKLFSDTCVSDDICKLDLSKLYEKGKRKLGIVINLDPHYKGGSHWVGMYMDINKGGIYFFDSYGLKPKKEILDLMEKLKIQGNKLIEDNILDVNDMEDDHTSLYKILKKNKSDIELEDADEFFINDLCFLCDNSSLKCSIEDLYKVESIDNNKLKLTRELNSNKNNLLHKSFKCYYNPNRFQFENSECGVYSMHFIEECLKGGKFKDVVSKIYKDAEMNKKRKFYYRPNLIELVG